MEGITYLTQSLQANSTTKIEMDVLADLQGSTRMNECGSASLSSIHSFYLDSVAL
jgi:hypothetical protein